jgi:dTDP-4-dehydrorhamnose reductase
MAEKTILITGADGQLGNALRASAGDSPHDFLFTDVTELDITDADAVFRYIHSNKVDYCINCAAYTQVDKAEQDQEKAHSINVRGVEHLARACQEHNTTFLHISTDFVFDGRTNVPYKEATEGNPINAYGVSKLNGELMALGNCERTVVVRTSWLYSVYGRNFVKTILKLCAERNELEVVYDQVGSPTHADDLAAALLTMIDQFESYPEVIDGLRGVYHYANSGVCSWYDLAVAINEIKALNVIVNPVHTDTFPTPAKRPRYSVLDTEKIRNAFGLSIPHWRQSLARCLAKL